MPRLRAVLPRSLKVQTAEQNAQETADQINDSIGGFLTPALLAFAGATPNSVARTSTASGVSPA